MIKNLINKLPNFSKRAAYSLLYITEFNCYRLDTDKAGVVVGQIESVSINCSTSAKLVEALKDVTDLKKPLAKKTWILYDRLNISLLSVPTMQIEGVEEESLLSVLQFELESLTGQSTMDMQLAYTLLGSSNEMSHFWVSQIASVHLEDMHKLLKKAGSRLEGLLHPAGLNAFLENPKETDWLRFECWSKQLIALRYTREKGLVMQMLNYETRQWRAQLDKWFATQPPTEHSETLFTGDIQMLPDTNSQIFLKDDEAVTQWLSLWWALALAAKVPPSVPILRYRSSVNQDLLLMVSGGSVALVICLGHLVWNLYQANHFNSEVEKLKQLETSMTQATKSLTDDKTKKTKLESDIKKLKGETDALPVLVTSLQRRPVQLLETLAKGRPDNLLLEEITMDKDVIHLRGVTLDATSANELASFLEKQLSVLGWSVAAPSKNNMAAFEQGGPWEFDISLGDLGLDGFKKKDEKTP